VSDDDLSQEIIRLVWSFDIFFAFAAVETEFVTFALIFFWSFNLSILFYFFIDYQ
jgi:hypothetical protein